MWGGGGGGNERRRRSERVGDSQADSCLSCDLKDTKECRPDREIELRRWEMVSHWLGKYTVDSVTPDLGYKQTWHTTTVSGGRVIARQKNAHSAIAKH